MKLKLRASWLILGLLILARILHSDSEDPSQNFDSQNAQQQITRQWEAPQPYWIQNTKQQDEENCEPLKRWDIELKAGYLYLIDSTMREILHSGGFSIRVEAGYAFWQEFAIWLDGGYFGKKGHSIGGHDSNEIKMGTCTVGLKKTWFFFSDFAFYAGLGPRLFIVKIENDSPFVKRHESIIGVGGGFMTGFFMQLKDGLFFDLFLDYSLKKVEGHSNGIASKVHDIRLDGLTAGIGVGWLF